MHTTVKQVGTGRLLPIVFFNWQPSWLLLARRKFATCYFLGPFTSPNAIVIVIIIPLHDVPKMIAGHSSLQLQPCIAHIFPDSHRGRSRLLLSTRCNLPTRNNIGFYLTGGSQIVWLDQWRPNFCVWEASVNWQVKLYLITWLYS